MATSPDLALIGNCEINMLLGSVDGSVPFARSPLKGMLT